MYQNRQRTLWTILLIILVLEISHGGRISQFLRQPVQTLIMLGCLLIALTIHEFAHALAADHLGDPNPRLQGRVSLNPLKHLDPFGTLMIILTGYGWGKPVEFDSYNLKNPVSDGALIAAAGPLSNILLASIIALFLRFGLPFLPVTPVITTIVLFLVQLFTINLSLAVFNLVPIYPLDGHHILRALLPASNRQSYDRFNRTWGLFVSLLIIFPLFGGTSIVSRLTGPAFDVLRQLLLGM